MKAVKLYKLILILAASTLALGGGTNLAWSTQAYSNGVTGEVTATPISGEIEVAHRIYHIKAGSAADQNFRSFNTGQIVYLVLDGPASSSTSTVIAIAAAPSNPAS
jgi:hypothetical protein